MVWVGHRVRRMSVSAAVSAEVHRTSHAHCCIAHAAGAAIVVMQQRLMNVVRGSRRDRVSDGGRLCSLPHIATHTAALRANVEVRDLIRRIDWCNKDHNE